MPLRLHEPIRVDETTSGELGLWRISESEAELRNSVTLLPEEAAQFNRIKGTGRRREFLAARRLLHEMSGRHIRGGLVKDEFGKPHLTDSIWQVSISHTHGLSAAIAHRRHCGVDVQRFVSKIERIAPRFMGPGETAFLTTENRLFFQHLVWSAKEAMYKAYGRRRVDFREHLFVDLATATPSRGRISGLLRKDELRRIYVLDYRIIDEDNILVAAIDQSLALD